MIVHQMTKDFFLHVEMRPFYRIQKSSVTKLVCVWRGRDGEAMELGFTQESLPFSLQVHNEQGFALRLESKTFPLPH